MLMMMMLMRERENDLYVEDEKEKGIFFLQIEILKNNKKYNKKKM